MSSARPSSPWLSQNMARALAASAPPLQPGHVMGAADDLSELVDRSVVISHLLECGADTLSVQRIVEALRALHFLAE